MITTRILGIFFYYCIFITSYVACTHEAKSRKTIVLPYFRRQVEEIEETTIKPKDIKDDHNVNLVSFLVKNVKEIFDDNTDKDEDHHVIEVSPLLMRSTIPFSSTESHNINVSYARRNTLYEYSNSTSSVVEYIPRQRNKSDNYSEIKRTELLHLSKNVVNFDSDLKGFENFAPKAILGLTKNSTYGDSDLVESKRSCIFCNNAVQADCESPKNKLIPSVVCERDDDLCYSQHTPFGVTDRGCFSVNHNITTYVCSCNLCNYISISEMPYIISTKEEWIENVIELSSTKHFKKSIFKDMSCLRCEVNTTGKTGDMLDSANCLEGNIGTLPTQTCEENEICAVRALRSIGYLWRGCVSYPLYNYWWALCDSDLCNYDPHVSIYDVVL